MGLLHEIQEALIDPNSQLGPILLKIRLLADRIGSNELEEWVRHESEGYPDRDSVPDYRRIEVAYYVSFADIVWRGENQQIPPAVIEKHCGEQWNTVHLTNSIGAIDQLIAMGADGNEVGVECSNLLLLLQGKLFDGASLTSVRSRLNSSAISEIQNTVRSRVLELTMRLEREVPGIAEVAIGKSLDVKAQTQDKIQQVVHMTVNGPNTMINSTGDAADITVNNVAGNQEAAFNKLMQGGVPEADARELSELLASEKPQGKDVAFGVGVQAWLAKVIPTVASGAWNISVSTATKLIEEVALRYYGLK